MPRYFFHLKDGVDILDHDGTECPGEAAARDYALELLLLATKTDRSNPFFVEVTDAAGRKVFRLTPDGQSDKAQDAQHPAVK